MREAVIGVPQVQEEKHNHCKGCAMGKNIRKPFPQSEHKSKGTLDLVHSDVCGTMSVHSFSGYSCCVTFIDDYSKKTWIYFLKAKSKVFQRFREFKTLVENQTRRKIRVLRTNNGGEYTSNEFSKYCSLEGFKKEHTMPHTPQHNGMVERKNGTMVGAAKAMLFDQGLPLFLRAEAYRTTVYIQNKCPHTALGRKTPEEVFTSTRLDVSHIGIFGIVYYCHIHADTRKKLDPSREKGLLVGYNETSKAYIVYIPARKRIIVSRDT